MTMRCLLTKVCHLYGSSSVFTLANRCLHLVQNFALRPTLVYNCAHVPALCNNVRNYLGSQTTARLHFDRYRPQAPTGQLLRSRKDERRGQSCPTNWIDTHGCPELNQPQWKSTENPFLQDAILWRNKADVPDKSRLARKNDKRDSDGNIKEPKYIKLGAVLSCDEWPAARCVLLC